MTDKEQLSVRQPYLVLKCQTIHLFILSTEEVPMHKKSKEMMHPMLHGHHSKASKEALKEPEGRMMHAKAKKKKKAKAKKEKK